MPLPMSSELDYWRKQLYKTRNRITSLIEINNRSWSALDCVKCSELLREQGFGVPYRSFDPVAELSQSWRNSFTPDPNSSDNTLARLLRLKCMIRLRTNNEKRQPRAA